MTGLSDDADLTVPPAVAAAHAAALRRFAAPGAFLDGATRRALVEATRAARACRLCASRRAALSPAAVAGTHERAGHDGALGAPLVELAHRLTTDPGRVTTAWFDALIAAGLSREEYVEATGLVGAATVVDTHAVALGGVVPSLPGPEPGEPSGEANPVVVDAGARVPIMDADRPLPPWDRRPGPGKVANIARALALVPFAQHEFWDVFTPHYRPLQLEPGDAMGRPQIEFVASRTSALNACFY